MIIYLTPHDFWRGDQYLVGYLLTPTPTNSWSHEYSESYLLIAGAEFRSIVVIIKLHSHRWFRVVHKTVMVILNDVILLAISHTNKPYWIWESFASILASEHHDLYWPIPLTLIFWCNSGGFRGLIFWGYPWLEFDWNIKFDWIHINAQHFHFIEELFTWRFLVSRKLYQWDAFTFWILPNETKSSAPLWMVDILGAYRESGASNYL